MGRVNKKTEVTVSPEMISADKIRYEIWNLQGIGARGRQEDSFTAVNALDEQKSDTLGLLFAVCDGMGGMKDGKLASETAVQSFRASFAAMDRTGNISEQLKESVYVASEAVERLLGGDGGSTVVIGIILNEKLHFASVGDSFFYLFRFGKLLRLNREHNICHEMYRENIHRESTETEECRKAEDAAALAQFLGMPGISDIDCTVRPLNLRKGDVLVACSDGVGGVLTEEEIIESMQWPTAADMCRRLEEHITEHQNPNQDNYTVSIIKCN